MGFWFGVSGIVSLYDPQPGLKNEKTQSDFPEFHCE